MLIQISYVVIYVLEGLMFWQYCKNIFHPSYSTKQMGIVLSVCYLLLYLISLPQACQTPSIFKYSSHIERSFSF